jgi:hypothetical protein
MVALTGNRLFLQQLIRPSNNQNRRAAQQVSSMQRTVETEIRIARSISEVESLREPWEKWPGHRDSDIDFYLTIVQNSPSVLRPHVIVLSRDGRLESILIGRLEHRRLAFKIGYIKAFHLTTRCLVFVYGGNRGAASPENSELLIHEIMRNLRHHEADLAILEPLPVDAPLLEMALSKPAIVCRDTPQSPQEHNLMALPDTIDEVYGRMSPQRRRDIRRKIKKFDAIPGGPLSITLYRQESDLPTIFQDAEVIARQTYQRALGVGFADSPEIRRRLELAARKGWLRAYLLYLGNRPCAFWIGMLYGQTFVGEYVGYDREFHALSPGMYLTMRVIERFCNRADGDFIRELDLGFGQAEYKTALCDKVVLEKAAFVFAPSWSGVSLKLLRSVSIVVEGAARKVLNSTKVMPRLKKAWRAQLARQSKKSQTASKTVPGKIAHGSPAEIDTNASAFAGKRTETVGQ